MGPSWTELGTEALQRGPCGLSPTYLSLPGLQVGIGGREAGEADLFGRKLREIGE